jgi:type II secretory pathway pseudopilin PulG
MWRRRGWKIPERIAGYLFKKKGIESEKGFTLIETLAGMFLLVLIGVALMASLTLSAKILADTDNRETARDLAVAEMEYIKNQAYSSSYSPDTSLIPSGSKYVVSVNTPVSEETDGNLQLITVIVQRNGSEVTRIEGYKVKWQ